MNFFYCKKCSFAQTVSSHKKLERFSDWMTDSGVITNKTALPITGFSYGYLSRGSRAKVSFGPLRCSGEREEEREGMTCASVK